MKLDMLAFGAHPDDVELGCGGTIALSVSQGKSVGIIDLTQGEMGTRGSIELRREEASKAKAILKVSIRENLAFRDGFFINDEVHQRAVIQKIRAYKPEVVICNAIHDRHIDHGKGNRLVNDACFLSGLTKVKTQSETGEKQDAWRPKLVLEYIQWNEIEPNIILDISGFLETKLEAVKAYSSQFHNPNTTEKETPISSLNFIESVTYRAHNLGRLIGTQAGEGFTSRQPLSVNNLNNLIR
ncbi:bacillithiol biosynthesis deacetylase BshB1 [Flavobacteriaceae bacterium]|nr:bacillithiol biosynthesis deacetylase BshB1 [Flavobacteriaceae bacterium]MDB3984952.1 bacillithiol biosynthesis deacetylase BshB1 [Flavobacteriaceae bacterium]